MKSHNKFEGRKGRNVAIDQLQEHRIKETKELMSGHGASCMLLGVYEELK